MILVNRLKEVLCGRERLTRPYIPAWRASLRRVAQAIDGSLAQGRQS